MTTTLSPAQRGAALLDRIQPNWASRVNPETLDIQFGDRCVLGQVFGDYWDALSDLGLTHGESDSLGFGLAAEVGLLDNDDFSFALRDQCWKALRDEWLTLVQERIGAVN